MDLNDRKAKQLATLKKTEPSAPSPPAQNSAGPDDNKKRKRAGGNAEGAETNIPRKKQSTKQSLHNFQASSQDVAAVQPLDITDRSRSAPSSSNELPSLFPAESQFIAYQHSPTAGYNALDRVTDSPIPRPVGVYAQSTSLVEMNGTPPTNAFDSHPPQVHTVHNTYGQNFSTPRYSVISCMAQIKLKAACEERSVAGYRMSTMLLGLMLRRTHL
jgi:hypothetical protein